MDGDDSDHPFVKTTQMSAYDPRPWWRTLVVEEWLLLAMIATFLVLAILPPFLG